MLNYKALLGSWLCRSGGLQSEEIVFFSLLGNLHCSPAHSALFNISKENQLMNRKRVFLALVFVAALAPQSTIISAQTLVHSKIALPGSWRATFTSTENPPQFAPIPALFTFTEERREHGVTEGTVVETDGGELVPIPPPNQAFGSPGHGVWRKIGKRKYEIKFLTIAVNPDGSLAATG